MSASSPSPPTVKSAMRTLDLIEYVVARPSGVVAQEIAIALAIPVSSLSYLLSTLVDRGYLTRDGRRYAAGPGLDRLRRPLVEQTLADRAAPLVEALRRDVNETASLFEPRGWELEGVVTATADHTLRYSIEVGARTPLHCVSSGKAYLAALPESDLARYFAESDRIAFTPATRVDPADVRADLLAIREQGFARTRDEWVVGIAAIGAVIRHADRPVGAISVALPTPRFTPTSERRMIHAVVATARRIEDLLDAS